MDLVFCLFVVGPLIIKPISATEHKVGTKKKGKKPVTVVAYMGSDEEVERWRFPKTASQEKMARKVMQTKLNK